MTIKKLYLFCALIFAGFVQAGCGSQNQNLANSNLAIGNCQSGTYYFNGQCIANGANTASCTYGQTYQNAYNYCQVGYVSQGNQCVCQSTTTNGAQGSCTTGYIQTNYGCFKQGPCQQGYAYITPYSTCIRY